LLARMPPCTCAAVASPLGNAAGGDVDKALDQGAVAHLSHEGGGLRSAPTVTPSDTLFSLIELLCVTQVPWVIGRAQLAGFWVWCACVCRRVCRRVRV
jgi:hypothetical protein